MLVSPVLTSLTIYTVLSFTGSAFALRAENVKRDNTTTVLPNYEYIIVGSGAGGGPLAARLAIAGKNVLLIEAGDDQGTTPYEELPALFAPASEYVPMSWDFYVRHYTEESRDAQNSKATYKLTNGTLYIGLDPPSDATFLGIWYPRAGTLGGCGAHNAMITVYPHESDWDNIKNITGDDSWDALAMRQYFERLEQNQYLTDFGYDQSGHGFDGWLGTSLMDDDYFLEDPKVLQLLTSAGKVLGVSNTTITNKGNLDSSFPLDLNTNYTGRDETTQRYRVPMAVSNGSRSSPRDFLLATAAAYDTLTIRLNCFVTNIRFDNSTGTPTAVGVDFIDGQSLYSADARTNSTTQTAGVPGSVNATAEVIISAGTFNTPQLLKLSGIGPAAELKSFGIDVVSDLPGVGSGLQDHYEISTVTEFEEEFELLSNCSLQLTADDECYTVYNEGTTGYTKGPYATNLLYGSVLQKSSVATVERDTMTVAGPFFFRGYFEGYAELAIADTKHWTWLHLKAHERNLAGTVNLTSVNPFDTPNINFHFFDDGTTTGNIDQLDVQPLVDAMSWARKVNADLASRTSYNFTEVWPGPDVATDEQVEDLTKNESWGHHASSTCKIGADDDEMAVLNSNFQVRGVNNLRVVDASAFPQIPGFFIVTSVYMISEKAADVILAAAAASPYN